MKFPTIVSIFLAFMTFHTVSFGQIAKGNFIMDGGFASKFKSYNHPIFYSHGATKEHAISFNPNISYFVSDRLAIGGGIMINSTTSNLEVGSQGLKINGECINTWLANFFIFVLSTNFYLLVFF